ncbi:nucleoporin Nup192p [[Candida] railenensis]|uniref:Nucleoporin Nup192p n=1 Tax=[Candida] railenensis TaxID=45579 RepID=A0A9P0QSA8_9ASCO|nr:nucleoporin Nup192p [[Candida] railenensis]
MKIVQEETETAAYSLDLLLPFSRFGMKLNWATETFSDCYNSIKYNGTVSEASLKPIQDDLMQLLVVPAKKESDSTLPEEVEFTDGKFKLNTQFMEAATILSSELALPTFDTAELLHEASTIEFQSGVDFMDSGRIAFFHRFQYILNIVGYLTATRQLHLITNDFQSIFSNLIASFESIYTRLNTLNELIDKQKITGDVNNLQFVNASQYSKSEIFNHHELLGSIYFNLISNYGDHVATTANYERVIEVITKNLKDEDIFTVHYLPGLLKFLTSFEEIKAPEVEKFHKAVTSKLTADYSKVSSVSTSASSSSDSEIDVSKSALQPLEVLLALIGYTSFISWCKIDEKRTSQYSFQDDILKYVEWCISYGALEKLLCIASDTTYKGDHSNFSSIFVYDFRSLLQKTLPSLTPIKIAYPGATELLNIASTRPDLLSNTEALVSTDKFKIGQDFNNDLVGPLLHNFFKAFVKNAAIILTSLRDSEEDFLLSASTGKEEEREENIKRTNNDTNSASDISSSAGHRGDSSDRDSIDLDDIASRSDLERFYLAFAYTHQNRPELCSLFWNEENTVYELLGLINWGLTNNTSPLITATFCILLGSLTYGNENDDFSVKIWEILINNNSTTSTKRNDYSKVSVDSICESLYYYIDMMNKNFKEDLQYQQQHQRNLLQDILLPTHTAVGAGNSSSIHHGGSGSGSVSNSNDDSEAITPIVIELAEDSVVFISGFIQLLSSIVKNLPSSSNPRSNEIMKSIFARFQPIICEFLKFDNLITNSKTTVGTSIFISDDSRVILINLIFDFLGAFVHEDLTLRYKIWDFVDRWIFKGGWPDAATVNSTASASASTMTKTNTLAGSSGDSSNDIGSGYKSVRIVQHFQNTLTQLSQVSNFIILLKKLLSNTNQDVKAFKKYRLLYPADLGNGYRNIGIWPYIEYLLLEVFAKSESLSEERLDIQLPILEIILDSLNEIDWVFLNDIAPVTIRRLDLNQCVEYEGVGFTFENFIKLHHSLAVLNYLFDENVYKVLFKILEREGESGEGEGWAVESILKITQSLLELQDTFINSLLPIIRNKGGDSTENNTVGNGRSNGTFAGYGTNMSIVLSTPKTVWDNIYYPKNIGLQGISNFYEIFVFNLPVIAMFGLFVGSFKVSISTSSIQILKGISQSSFFTNSKGNVLNKNRLLTTFESINESERIKFAFMKQLQRSIDTEEDLEVKFKVLQFLIENIEPSDASLSHYLLGYEFKGNSITLEEKGNQNSLLKTLLLLLDSSLNSISDIDYKNGNVHIIEFAPAALASMILEILVKLCRDFISSKVTLDYLREEGALFTKLIRCQPNIDLSSIWATKSFDGDLQSTHQNSFTDGECIVTLFSFIRHRNMILQYLSLEFHATSNQKSITRSEYYIDLLLNDNEFLNGSPKVLSFLDILNFRLDDLDVSSYESFDQKYNLSNVLSIMKRDHKGNEVLNLEVMEKIYKVVCKMSTIISKESKMLFSQEIMDEGNHIIEFLTKYVVYEEFRSTQLSCLHSWTQLIQVLLTDGKMTKSKKSNFIMEVFQIILPKINDYLESDILFAKELISLSVLLFDFYDREENSRSEVLFPLFQTCINGILSSYSTSELRSDLYVLANKFLQKSFENKEILKDLGNSIKSVDKKFVDILCNDSIYAEGSQRITALILLESLIHLSSISRINFVLDSIIKNNSLSLLVRSLKRTDEIFNSNGDSGFSLNNLLYELTAFKTTLYLLLRIATTRSGASQLIQCELFPIIKSSKFLAIDPDLGLNLKIASSVAFGTSGGVSEKANDNNNFSVHLSLDTPLSLAGNSDSNSGDISYFEFLVPVFQLITGVLVSMGPSYKPSIVQGKELLKHFHQLIVGVLKRDALIESKKSDSKKFSQVYSEESISNVGLRELVKLIVLLDSLVSEHGESK